ncbi:MAG: ABC transporter ATP-binding protein [Reyranella sp.]|nr:ABC transporter ATP-binding protein [Reyranella sp.]
MTMSKAVGIEIAGVNLSYGATHVLKDVDLAVRPGEFFAFLGPSGCGKTTLLRLIAGFAQAQTGQVLLDGRDVAPLPPWKRDVGMVFQSYALWPHMTVAKNVAFGLEERRLPRAEIDRRVAQALDLVGLADLAGRRPAQLSGGQQQRVAVARTIAIEPKVLLLDEPLSNLDAKMRVGVRRELRALQQRLGLTTIFVTHDQEEANTICDRIAVMDAGTIRQVGTPMELYEKPANLFVASFLGSANILGDGHGISVPAGKRLVFRPQHASLSPVDGAALRGPVTHREFLGAAVRYSVRVGDNEILVEAPFQSGGELRAVGDRVGVALPPERMLYLPA